MPRQVGSSEQQKDMDVKNDMKHFLAGIFLLKATRAMVKAPHQGVFDSTLALVRTGGWESLMGVFPHWT